MLTISFPDRFRTEDTWDTAHYGHAWTPAGGFRFSGETTNRTDDDVAAYMARDFHRQPLALLQARRQPGFAAMAAGRGRVGATEVELVNVHRSSPGVTP